MDELGLDQIDILGHHTGSKIAIELAHQCPMRVRSLILISVSVVDAESFANSDKSFAPLPLDDAGEGLQNWWKTLRAFYGDAVPLEFLFQQYVESLRAGPSFHWGFRAAHQYNAKLVQNVKSLETPITVICPGDDLAEITPQIMPHIKHGALIERPHWHHGFLAYNTAEAVQTVLYDHKFS